MAKFDISTSGEDSDGGASRGVGGSILKIEDSKEANSEPAPRARRLISNCTRMGAERKPLGPIVRGLHTPGLPTRILACLLGVTSAAAADPTATIPDPPPRTAPAVVPPARFRPSWDLDGTYLWLGPTGTAGHVDATWDSTFGGQAAVLRVREREALGVVGGAIGASLWTERPGGRVWLDAIAGTRLAGRMVGASLGPLVELGDLTHPRLGGALGVWGFFGVTPFARIGIVDELGGFAEIGLHIALPVLRR